MNKRLTKWEQRWRYNTTTERPSREKLCSYSPSEFKTLLKLKGYKIPRNFFKNGSIANKDNRLYRFRYWGDVYDIDNTNEFVVDISCPLYDFDRWANSTDRTITFYEWTRE